MHTKVLNFIKEIVLLLNFMQNSMDKPDKNAPQKLPKLRLPFEKRKQDAGVWSYDHRVGICITLIAYLLAGIVFVSAKIQLRGASNIAGILVEFPEEERPQEQDPEEQKRLDQLAQEDFSNVSNRISNENASSSSQFNAALRDDRGTKSSELYGDAEAVQERIRANREAYEANRRREQELLDNAARRKSSNTEPQDVKVKGRVTVSFSFTDPIRTSAHLVIPAYMCEGGGEVVVIAMLNNNGEVVSATVDRSLSTGDACMQETAIEAAKSSRFNIDRSAPARQRGTISYIFIPQ